jgi:Zn-dependent protease with chaperone function
MLVPDGRVGRCIACGGTLSPGDRFCAECGRPVPPPAEAQGWRFVGPAGSVSTERAALDRLRHPKESAYFSLAVAVSVLAWLVLIWIVLLIGWLLLIPAAIVLWVSDRLLRAQLLGNSVRIGESQYPEIYAMLAEFSRRLGLEGIPEVFVVNGQGAVNAVAIRLLQRKYILLLSDMVDLLLSTNSLKELSFVLGHELGHHAMGHTRLGRKILLWPASFVPFLGPAYLRACELTADRVGAWLVNSRTAAVRGLVALACGSRSLAAATNLEAFRSQEDSIPPLFGLLSDVFSSHPRITRRVQELMESDIAA